VVACLAYTPIGIALLWPVAVIAYIQVFAPAVCPIAYLCTATFGIGPIDGPSAFARLARVRFSAFLAIVQFHSALLAITPARAALLWPIAVRVGPQVLAPAVSQIAYFFAATLRSAPAHRPSALSRFTASDFRARLTVIRLRYVEAHRVESEESTPREGSSTISLFVTIVAPTKITPTKFFEANWVVASARITTAPMTPAHPLSPWLEAVKNRLRSEFSCSFEESSDFLPELTNKVSNSQDYVSESEETIK